MPTKIYFASPLFTEMEQDYNKRVVKLMKSFYGSRLDVYLPQDNEAINDKSGYADSIAIAQGDNAYLEEADILVAVLDGQTIDVGVAAEIGYFYSTGKPILAIYSDSRQGTHGNMAKVTALEEIAESQFSYINLYVVGLVKQRGEIFSSKMDLVSALHRYL